MWEGSVVEEGTRQWWVGISDNPNKTVAWFLFRKHHHQQAGNNSPAVPGAMLEWLGLINTEWFIRKKWFSLAISHSCLHGGEGTNSSIISSSCHCLHNQPLRVSWVLPCLELSLLEHQGDKSLSLQNENASRLLRAFTIAFVVMSECPRKVWDWGDSEFRINSVSHF